MENSKQYADAVAQQVLEYRLREYQTNHYWELGAETTDRMAEAFAEIVADYKVKMMFGSGFLKDCTDRERSKYAHQVILLEALTVFLKELHQKQVECDIETRLGI